MWLSCCCCALGHSQLNMITTNMTVSSTILSAWHTLQHSFLSGPCHIPGAVCGEKDRVLSAPRVCVSPHPSIHPIPAEPKVLSLGNPSTSMHPVGGIFIESKAWSIAFTSDYFLVLSTPFSIRLFKLKSWTECGRGWQRRYRKYRVDRLILPCHIFIRVTIHDW